jgi:hypothetical protein
VRESLGKSLGESLQDLLPMSSRPVTISWGVVGKVTAERVVRQESCSVRESLGKYLSLEELLPMSIFPVTKLWARRSASCSVRESLNKSLGESLEDVEPSSNKASPSQPGTDSKREMREIISWLMLLVYTLLSVVEYLLLLLCSLKCTWSLTHLEAIFANT